MPVQADFDAQQPLFAPETAPGADLVVEHSVLVEQHSLLAPTAPGADLADEHSVLVEQHSLFAPTAPGAAFEAEHSVFDEQHSLLPLTAPGAVLWVLLQAVRRAATERAARVVKRFMIS
ncbi:MAG: hypothetical protein RI967_350 [Planctomycetota bacterium]